ncbi:hypothetical protein JCM15831A_13380 [Asaia astilbis]
MTFWFDEVPDPRLMETPGVLMTAPEETFKVVIGSPEPAPTRDVVVPVHVTVPEVPLQLARAVPIRNVSCLLSVMVIKAK